MLTTPHAVTGATIAVLIPMPELALPLAIGSHFILDSIPHWQEIFYPYDVTWKTWVRVPIDLVIAITLVSIIAFSHKNEQSLIFLSAICANLPDMDSLICLWKKPLKISIIKRFYNWHCKIQKETSSFRDLLTQILLTISMTIISLSK